MIALGAILLTGVNLYVQSQGTHAKIQQELSRRLGTALGIRSMSVTPWGGLELSGITIAQPSPVGPKHFLEAKTFRLRVRFLSLFSRRLVIKDVALINPNVVWLQDVEGKWKLPRSRGTKTATPTVSQPDAESEPAQTSQTRQTQTAPVVAISPANLPSPAQAIVSTPSPMQESRLAVPPEVRRLSIKNGNFSFLDHTGRLLEGFDGVNFRTSIRSALALHGDAKVARISLQDRFFLEQLRSPLRYEPDVLELSKISQ